LFTEKIIKNIQAFEEKSDTVISKKIKKFEF